MLPIEKQILDRREAKLNDEDLHLNSEKIKETSKEDLIKYIEILDSALTLAVNDIYTGSLGSFPDSKTLLKMKVSLIKEIGDYREKKRRVELEKQTIEEITADIKEEINRAWNEFISINNKEQIINITSEKTEDSIYANKYDNLDSLFNEIMK